MKMNKLKKGGTPSIMRSAKTSVMSEAKKKVAAYRKKNPPLTKTQF